jgi:transcriptional regulator with XRE-family HTH domain
MKNSNTFASLHPFLQFLKKERTQSAISIRKAAEMLYLSPSQYFDLENGRVKLDMERFLAITNTFKLDPLVVFELYFCVSETSQKSSSSET